MPSTWTVRLLIGVPAAIIVILMARTYMRKQRIDYWTMAEDANKPNDRDAQIRILFVGNSFIHYNGGAEKVRCIGVITYACSANSHCLLRKHGCGLHALSPGQAMHAFACLLSILSQADFPSARVGEPHC